MIHIEVGKYKKKKKKGITIDFFLPDRAQRTTVFQERGLLQAKKTLQSTQVTRDISRFTTFGLYTLPSACFASNLVFTLR